MGNYEADSHATKSMSIKTATRIAICGVAAGLVMSLAVSYLQDWMLTKSGMQKETSITFIRVYWDLRTVLFDGSILLFLITLLSKQKD